MAASTSSDAKCSRTHDSALTGWGCATAVALPPAVSLHVSGHLSLLHAAVQARAQHHWQAHGAPVPASNLGEAPGSAGAYVVHILPVHVSQPGDLAR